MGIPRLATRTAAAAARLLLLPLAVLGSAASAQGTDDETICLSFLRIWQATAAEVRAIETAPAPASFRESYEGRCNGNLAPGNLVQWHLAFGSERSTAAAIAYLESRLLRGLPAPEAYAAETQRAWHRALPVLRRAYSHRQPGGRGRDAAQALVRQSHAVVALEKLVDARYNFHFFGDAWLQAAAAFGSVALLDRAERYTTPLAQNAAFLAPLEAQAPVDGLLHFNLHVEQSDDLRMRAAILRAQLSRDPADLARAEALVDALERPEYRRLVASAFSAGDDFCDVDDSGDEADAQEELCREDHALQDRTVSWAMNRAVLDLLGGEPGADPAEAVVRLLARERAAGALRGARTFAENELLRLRLQQADRRRLQMEAPPDRSDAPSHWREALKALREAADLVPPSDHPTRFRRIAEAWLQLWERRTTLPALAESENHRISPSLARYAAWLHAVLEDLPAIATAD